MLNKSKKIVFIVATLHTMFLFSVASDYLDESLPQKSYVYAPHRESYLLNNAKEKDKKQKEEKKCFFCRVNEDERLRQEDLIKSYEYHNVVLNGFPYNKGHILIAPKRHIASLDDLTLEERLELLHIIGVSVKVLEQALEADGFNIGINLGNAGGASIPEHLHIHIVPRYRKGNASNSFMSSACKTTVIDWDMGKLAVLLRKHFDLIEGV
ncbi:DUF4922 domain-containing protein [Candidatus Dependentiae bacterium]